MELVRPVEVEEEASNYVEAQEDVGVSKRRKHVRVLFDFVAENKDELSVNQDEILIVADEAADEGWLLVKNHKLEEGLVPEAYVQELTEAEGLNADAHQTLDDNNNVSRINDTENSVVHHEANNLTMMTNSAVTINEDGSDDEYSAILNADSSNSTNNRTWNDQTLNDTTTESGDNSQILPRDQFNNSTITEPKSENKNIPDLNSLESRLAAFKLTLAKNETLEIPTPKPPVTVSNPPLSPLTPGRNASDTYSYGGGTSATAASLPSADIHILPLDEMNKKSTPSAPPPPPRPVVIPSYPDIGPRISALNTSSAEFRKLEAENNSEVAVSPFASSSSSANHGLGSDVPMAMIVDHSLDSPMGSQGSRSHLVSRFSGSQHDEVDPEELAELIFETSTLCSSGAISSDMKTEINALANSGRLEAAKKLLKRCKDNTSASSAVSPLVPPQSKTRPPPPPPEVARQTMILEKQRQEEEKRKRQHEKTVEITAAQIESQKRAKQIEEDTVALLKKQKEDSEVEKELRRKALIDQTNALMRQSKEHKDKATAYAKRAVTADNSGLFVEAYEAYLNAAINLAAVIEIGKDLDIRTKIYPRLEQYVSRALTLQPDVAPDDNFQWLLNVLPQMQAYEYDLQGQASTAEAEATQLFRIGNKVDAKKSYMLSLAYLLSYKKYLEKAKQEVNPMLLKKIGELFDIVERIR